MHRFVTIKPALMADGKTLKRVPMPAAHGLPGTGALLPAEGCKVPLTRFVKRLLADKDAVDITPPATATPASTTATAAAKPAAGSAGAATATTSTAGAAA